MLSVPWSVSPVNALFDLNSKGLFKGILLLKFKSLCMTLGTGGSTNLPEANKAALWLLPGGSGDSSVDCSQQCPPGEGRFPPLLRCLLSASVSLPAPWGEVHLYFLRKAVLRTRLAAYSNRPLLLPVRSHLKPSGFRQREVYISPI